MDEQIDYLEQNVSRLIRTSFPEPARLSPQLRQNTYRQLLAQFRAEKADEMLPPRISFILVCALCALAICSIARLSGSGVSFGMTGVSLVVGAVLVINLAVVPVASVIVVIRSRYV